MISVYRCELCDTKPEVATTVCVQCKIHYCDGCRASFHPSRGPFTRHTLDKIPVGIVYLNDENHDPLVDISNSCIPVEKIVKRLDPLVEIHQKVKQNLKIKRETNDTDPIVTIKVEPSNVKLLEKTLAQGCKNDTDRSITINTEQIVEILDLTDENKEIVDLTDDNDQSTGAIVALPDKDGVPHKVPVQYKVHSEKGQADIFEDVNDSEVEHPKELRAKVVSTDIVPSTNLRETKEKYQNGLLKDVEYYLQVEWFYIVAKRSNPLPSEKPLGLLSVDDYKTLKSGQLSIDCMNYLLDFILPQRFINLTLFANQILDGINCFDFSIHERTCFIPLFDDVLQEWVLYFINTIKSTFCYVASDMGDQGILQEKLQLFGKFIDAYNSSNRHNKLKPVSSWKAVTLSNNDFGHYLDSGVCVVNYVNRLTNKVKDDPFDSNKLRKTLLSEVLKFSEDMTDICLKCGQFNDSAITENISWSMCDSCKRWIHDVCFDLKDENCPICTYFT